MGDTFTWIDEALERPPSDLYQTILEAVGPKHAKRKYSEAIYEIKERAGHVAIAGKWVQWEGSIELTIVKHLSPAEAQASVFGYMTQTESQQRSRKQNETAMMLWNRLRDRIRKVTGKVPLGDVWV